jgi:hypothetical protein
VQGTNDLTTLQTTAVPERLRRLPEALLLTAGYYASRIPPLNELLRRLD